MANNRNCEHCGAPLPVVENVGSTNKPQTPPAVIVIVPAGSTSEDPYRQAQIARLDEVYPAWRTCT